MKTTNVKAKVPSRFLRFTLLSLSLLFLTFSCSNEDAEMLEPQNMEPNIVEVLESYNRTTAAQKSSDDKYSDSEPTFEILSVALAKTKLASTVSRNRLTVFAPTDKAFEAIGLNKKNIADVPGIVDILLYHVVGQPVYSSDLSSGPVETVQGTDVIVNVDGDNVLVNNAIVTIADIKARNGVIHVLDSVLSIPSLNLVELALSQDPEFSILVEAVTMAGLGEVLAEGGPFTVFAPTNQAFMDLLEATPFTSLEDVPMDLLTQILLYHVVDGYAFSNQLANGFVPTINGAAVQVNLDMAPMVYINDSNVIIPNVQATNGVVHAIDKVLMPPTMNLVELASSFDPEFSLLLQAATTAGLAGVLSGDGPYEQLTVFAPTNAAFLSLLGLTDIEEAKAVISGLDVTTLTNILLYHVVEGRVYSSDLSSGAVSTLNGDFDLDLGTLTIDGNASLVPSLLNVQATNGVIHVIDAVLMP
ncbi:fasciclin domain-containing protein [Aestuariivivens sediminicola]|uniref:fasciclin domain-containing protein n=1 Tax=Aestuariivivens sediminicola TaxID=2913560 RepID=UPI001F5779F6|nr:fasciclin domain-containing protein [Aestuariivivens sediminicola]